MWKTTIVAVMNYFKENFASYVTRFARGDPGLWIPDRQHFPAEREYLQYVEECTRATVQIHRAKVLKYLSPVNTTI